MNKPEKEDKVLELLVEYIKKFDRRDDDIKIILNYLDKNDFRIHVIQDAILIQIEELKELRNHSTSLDTEVRGLRQDFARQNKLIRYLYKGYVSNNQKKEARQESMMLELLSLSQRVSRLEGLV
ncbi:MAG: hypothetical protein NW226_18545 [Microscillaceae bacterium]|nr:hypothetical protein [Microscillaceae bacterium]